MVIDPYILIYIISSVLFFALLWIARLEIRIKKLLQGQNGKSLEATIFETKRGIHELEQFKKEMEIYLQKVEQRLRQSTQGVETIRFNPFKGSGDGGNQSFAVALLNENGDGVVLSSLYARERMSMYAKPIKQCSSEFELTQEEKEVIKKAHDKVK